jgi:hypothetical protein
MAGPEHGREIDDADPVERAGRALGVHDGGSSTGAGRLSI